MEDQYYGDLRKQTLDLLQIINQLNQTVEQLQKRVSDQALTIQTYVVDQKMARAKRDLAEFQALQPKTQPLEISDDNAANH